MVGLAAGVSCFVIATVIGPALSLVRASVKELSWSALAQLKTPTTLRAVSATLVIAPLWAGSS
jgi:hypothetical protein